jgi:hypothetical protein
MKPGARTKAVSVSSFIGLSVLSVPLHADEPPEPPHSRKIDSGSCSCWAYTDAKAKVTSGYRAVRTPASPRAPDAKGGRFELWRVPGWYRVAALSHDCDYLVTGYDGANLLPIAYERGTIMLAFHAHGRLVRQVRLDELVLDLSKLRRTESHWEWGYYGGVEKDHYYRVNTNDRGSILYDMATGQLVVEAK